MTAERRPPDGTPTTAAPARANTWSGPSPRMREVRHVHGDHDPRAWHWFARGPVVAADGGHPGEDRPRRQVENEQLRDVAHRPAHDEPVNRVWARGAPAAREPEPAADGGPE